MARKKKPVEPIVGLGKDPKSKLTVQKSMPLASLWRSNMTLAEFKILDTYLSRINSHDPEKRTVVFTKGELEKLLGVTKISKKDLVSRLKGIGRSVELPMPNNPKKVHTVWLFEEAIGDMDDDGLWTIRLTCTPSAMKYIFNVENLGYLRYKLRCITSLTSRYTYVLFIYLEQNRFRKSWEVGVDELRQILNCDQDESYAAFKVFNDRVLKRCQNELQEKSECRFSYVPVKNGRKVVAVRFTLETLADSIEAAIPGQLSLKDYEDPDDPQLQWYQKDVDDPLALLSSACGDEFSQEEMQEIFTIISLKAPEDLPVPPGDPDNVELSRYHYLAQMYARMNTYASKKPIRSRFQYFKSMLSKAEE